MPESNDRVCSAAETSAVSDDSESSPSGSAVSVSSDPAFVWRLVRLPGALAIQVVRLYQYLISPMLGKTCRFHPSCSQYFILSVQKSGLLRGLWKGTIRICRCHPWNPGGYDPP